MRAQRNGAEHHTSFTFSLLNDYVLKRRPKIRDPPLLQAQSPLSSGRRGTSQPNLWAVGELPLTLLRVVGELGHPHNAA